MYLEHFNLKELPFTLTPNTDFFCQLPGHQEALNILLVSLRNGEGFMKIVAEIGTGKTLLCRMLLKKLRDEFLTAYLPNPDLTPLDFRKALYCELGIPGQPPNSQHELLSAITEHLIKLHNLGKRVVLLIDEAQAMSTQCLEALRLLTNLETKTKKLLQVVLFGQPELDVRLKKNNLRQLKQRITFSYYLSPLTREQTQAYLCHRLAMAGHTMGVLFTRRASHLLFRASRGVPRLINILCHKAMMVAYGRGDKKISRHAMYSAVKDTECVVPRISYARVLLTSALLLLGLLASLKAYILLNNHVPLSIL